jgi:uncharacterized membrane protein
MTSSGSVAALDPREILLAAVRWSHAAAAVALLGGSLFQVLFLGPVLRGGGAELEPVRKATDVGFRELVDLSLVVFLVSGGLLTFERLSSGAAGTLYVVLLGVKLLLSFLFYRWAFALRRGRGWDNREAKLMVGAGFLILLVATLLKTVYEGGLRS